MDFETADYAPDSACAIGLVRVCNGDVTARSYRLIRPPRSWVRFTNIHGLRWEDLCEEPCFARVWEEVRPILDGAAFLAAHNASFDRAVLRAGCMAAGCDVPALPFVCTVRLARNVLGIRPATLSNVCARLEIPLRHHHALSDAEACAAVVLAAKRRMDEQGG